MLQAFLETIKIIQLKGFESFEFWILISYYNKAAGWLFNWLA